MITIWIHVVLSSLVVSLAATLVAVSVKQFLEKVNLVKEFAGFVILSLIMSIPEFFIIVYGRSANLPIQAVLTMLASSVAIATTVLFLIFYLVRIRKGKIQLVTEHLEEYLKDISFVLFVVMLTVVDGVLTKIDSLVLFLAYIIFIFYNALERGKGKAIEASALLNEAPPTIIGMTIMSLVVSYMLLYLAKLNLSPAVLGIALSLVTTSPQIVPALLGEKLTLEESVGSAITTLTIGLALLPFFYGDVTLTGKEIGMFYISFTLIYILIILSKIKEIGKEELVMLTLMFIAFIIYVTT